MTVSKGLALKMKEVGFPQESLYYWQKWKGSEVAEWKLVNYKLENILECYYDTASAPTATEILAELPTNIVKNEHECDLQIDPLTIAVTKKRAYIVHYSWMDKVFDNIPEYDTFGNTLEEALGEMFCQLKKEKVI